MAGMLEQFRCPVCFELPEGKVFQCKNGHTFCNDCSSYLKTCPQCRAHLGSDRIRNRTLEQLLDMMEFACPNKQLGCDKLLRRHELTDHLKFCKFEQFYFCKLIGFLECSYSTKPGDPKLLDHLHEHGEIQASHITQGDDEHGLLLHYENLLGTASKLEKGSVSIWTPHLAHYMSTRNGEGQQTISLLFLCQISEVTRNAAWICLSLSSSPTTTATAPECIQFRIKETGTTARDGLLSPEMTWRAPVLTFQDIDKDLESYALRIPVCTLSSLCPTGSVQMHVKVVRQQNSIPAQVQDNSRRWTMKELNKVMTKPSLALQKRRHGCERSGDSVSDEDVEEDESRAVVFRDVYCNECGQRPLTDIRYKCLQCIDFDLCKRCMEKRETHQHHVFARIQDLRQNELINLKHRVRSQKGKSSYI